MVAILELRIIEVIVVLLVHVTIGGRNSILSW